MAAPNVIIKQADPQPGPATGSIYDVNLPATQTPIMNAQSGPPWSVYLPPGTYAFVGSASGLGPFGKVTVAKASDSTPIGTGDWKIDAAKRVAGVQVHFVVE
ncbi:MAG: hypothetical protein JOZ72_15085 [Alphaproteobacteria bacterium]|nr:hypothetical protein [Alphaproteobacteria bacterium]